MGGAEGCACAGPDLTGGPCRGHPVLVAFRQLSLPGGGDSDTFTGMAEFSSEAKHLKGGLMLKRPDWEYWGKMRDLSLRDALVLSLNLCPHSYNHENKSGRARKFAKRYFINLQIVRSNIYSSDWVVGRICKKEFDIDTSFTTVDFPKFCKWAFDVVKFADLPDQMKNLGSHFRSPSPPSTSVAKPEPSSVSHQTKGGRRDMLSSVIDKARSMTDNPDKWQEVWPILCRLAEGKHPPLIGVADTSVKYQDGDTVKFLTKDNFRKRVGRLVCP
jgi:hypothetical protein